MLTNMIKKYMDYDEYCKNEINKYIPYSYFPYFKNNCNKDKKYDGKAEDIFRCPPAIVVFLNTLGEVKGNHCNNNISIWVYKERGWVAICNKMVVPITCAGRYRIRKLKGMSDGWE